MKNVLFFPADAHEGPVWVARQNRLYYTTKTHLDGRRRVDIEYLDFSPYLQNDDTLSDLPERIQHPLEPATFVKDANMANGMRLANDGTHLLVAEQGYGERNGGVTLYHLQTGQRAELLMEYDGKPFNSPNKAIQSKAGHLVVSDPDYAFRQGFRPPPVLEPNLYLLPKGSGELKVFRCGLEMPHGLMLSPDERTLFVTDTSNDGAHEDGVELHRRKSVWKFAFDPEAPAVSGPGTCCFAVAEGVPDGMVVTDDRLLVAGGDGVYVADLKGKLLGKIRLSETAVNLALAGEDRHLFVTIDKGVVFLRNWWERVGEEIEVEDYTVGE